MIISKDFTKAVNRIFLISVGLALISILLSYLDLSGLKVSGKNSTLSIVVFQARTFLPMGVFWFFVAFLTNEKKGALIAFLIKFLSWGYLTFQLLSSGYSSEIYFISNFLSSILAYAAFGLFHFKKPTGLYLLLVYALMRGIGVIGDVYGYHDILHGLLRIINLHDLFHLEISLGENSYRPVNLLVPIINMVYLPLRLIVFWFVFNSIKNSRRIDLSFRTVRLFSKLSALSFSTIFWTLRLPFSISVIGIASYMSRVFDKTITPNTALSLVSICLALFIIGSIYRNFLSAFFVSRGEAPGWNYFLLNIPIVNVFIWAYLIFNPAESQNDSSSQSENPEGQTGVSYPEKLQDQFVKNNRNNGIKVLIFLFIVLSFILKLAGMDSRLIGSDYGDPVLFSLFTLISLGLTIWYFSDSRALFILFSIQSAILIVVGLFALESYTQLIGASAMINLVVYYSLFHFDKLKFEDPETANTQLSQAEEG